MTESSDLTKSSNIGKSSSKTESSDDSREKILGIFRLEAPFGSFCVTFGLSMVSSVVILFFFHYFQITTEPLDFSSIVYIFAISAVLSTFVLMFYGGFADKEELNQDEMRHIFAASLLIGFIILTLGAIINVNLKDNTIVAAYIQMVGVIVGFYFGHKSAIQSQVKSTRTPTAKKGVIDKGVKGNGTIGKQVTGKAVTGKAVIGKAATRKAVTGKTVFGDLISGNTASEIPTVKYQTTGYPVSKYQTTEYPVSKYQITGYTASKYQTTEYSTTEYLGTPL